MTRAGWIAIVVALLAALLWWGTRSRPPAPESISEAPTPGAAAAAAAAAPGPEPAPAPSSAPQAALRPPEPEANAVPYVDAEGQPSRELVRAALEAALADHLPSHKLAPDDVERITDAAVRLRVARRALRELPPTEDAAGLRRTLVEEITAADAEFAEVMEMSFAEFTQAAEPASGVGVDRHAPDEPVAPPEYLDDFR